MITTTAMIKLNKTYGNYMVDLRIMNKKLFELLESYFINKVTGYSTMNSEKRNSFFTFRRGWGNRNEPESLWV